MLLLFIKKSWDNGLIFDYVNEICIYLGPEMVRCNIGNLMAFLRNYLYTFCWIGYAELSGIFMGATFTLSSE